MIRVHILLFTAAIIVGHIYTTPDTVVPEGPIYFPVLPKLEGALQPNTVLQQAEVHWENISNGPESLAWDEEGISYLIYNCIVTN